MKHNKRLRITQDDFLLANRRASRMEEIEAHGRQIIFRTVKQKSKKVYDRNSLKRAGIKSDDGSFYIYRQQQRRPNPTATGIPQM